MLAYRAGDVCRVHCDRRACEHSLSLTLDCSDGKDWPLRIGKSASPRKDVAENFGEEGHASIVMAPGDALLYRGSDRRHARTEPNPNRWSAHLFIHWVERDGSNRDEAFEGEPEDAGAGVNFA